MENEMIRITTSVWIIISFQVNLSLMIIHKMMILKLNSMDDIALQGKKLCIKIRPNSCRKLVVLEHCVSFDCA